jgi:hypothetical protein
LIHVDFHVAAATELNAAVSFYESAMSGAGKAFVSDVKNAIELLKNYPDAGARIGRKLRKLTLKRFPFSLIYRHETPNLLILAVAHNRRRPGYWKGRV